MGSGFIFKAIPHMLPKEKWGESTILSVQLESGENGTVDRHKLAQSWSLCTQTEQHLGDSLHCHLRKEGKMEIHGYSSIPISTSACNKGKRLVNCLAKSSHSFCGTNWATEQTLLHTLWMALHQFVNLFIQDRWLVWGFSLTECWS